ncbi:MAG: DUF1015 domain-containing protein [Cyclobacteriaceae bacterium]|nr:DUF1015 domain-containing protein [Cyclobacteriaceae bacterium]
MALIKPLRAWRYNNNLSAQIENLTSPLFDVVSQKQRNALYQNPYNSIHLSVPQPPNPAQRSATVLEEWKKNGIIKQDALPGIYVYYQYFRIAGSSKEFCRKGFICNIFTYDWEDHVILRHENTIPQAVNDRIEILEASQLNVSPTHGLYTDTDHILESYMDDAIHQPIYEAEDYQGVRDVLGVIHDADIIKKFITTIKDKKIILADGHHRYEGSLVYKQKCISNNPNHTGKEAYNFHMMYLTNTESDDLRILPTHRLINGLPHFSEDEIIQKLNPYFEIRLIEDADTINEIIVGKKWAFGLIFANNCYKLRLKADALAKMTWQFPDTVKQLDLTVMHYFIIEKALGIAGKEQRKSSHIQFDRSFGDCLSKVIKGEAQMAIITNEVSIEEVKQVCESGSTMPQKSTYFYPKVICGFLFASIKEEEFMEKPYSPYA